MPIACRCPIRTPRPVDSSYITGGIWYVNGTDISGQAYPAARQWTGSLSSAGGAGVMCVSRQFSSTQAAINGTPGGTMVAQSRCVRLGPAVSGSSFLPARRAGLVLEDGPPLGGV